MNKIGSKKGIGLIEVVVGAALILVLFSGIISAFNFYLKGAVSLTDNIKAEFLAVEGVEALRSIRDDGFGSFSGIPRATNNYISFNGSKWQSTTTPEIIDGVYSRSFQVRDVMRDGSGQIAPSGTIDPDTLLVEVRVSWADRGKNTERILSTYLTNAVEI
jgi:hypothetical protein